MDNINKKQLFLPDGDDSDRRLLGSPTTNIIDTTNVKYKWATEVWDTMMANFWIPQKYPMLNDIKSFGMLTNNEKEAYLKVLSFLIYLDSIQTNNLPNISEYITAPEVVLCLANQTFQEANHSVSYSYILNSAFDIETSRKSIYYWREDEIMLKRNAFIANIYQEHVNNPTERSFVSVITANYLLEGLYFYNGFNFFYNLASRGLMTDTCTQIRFINRDEYSHCDLFAHIIVDLFEENPEFKDRYMEMVESMFRTAVEQEIEFGLHVVGNDILGMNEDSIVKFTHWLANERAAKIGMGVLYPDAPTENPYKHLEAIAAIEDEDSNKANIFETKALSYKQANCIDGWDEI